MLMDQISVTIFIWIRMLKLRSLVPDTINSINELIYVNEICVTRA